MTKDEILYVVGMKTYDASGKLIRDNYTFISGPFAQETDAMDAAEKTMDDLLAKYSSMDRNDSEFRCVKDDASIRLVREENGKVQCFLALDVVHISAKVPAVMAGGPVTASIKGRDSKNEEIIFRRLQKKAKQALAEIKI